MNTITRLSAIDRMIEERLHNWDSTDTGEVLEHGRVGYAEMNNVSLETEWEETFALEPVTITGEEPTPTIEVPRADYDELVKALRHANNQLQYLTPERWDDDEHEVNYIRMLTMIENALTKTVRKG